MIYLSKDEQESGFARCANAPIVDKPEPVENLHESQIAEKKKGIQHKELDIQDAQLDVRLKEVKKALEPEKTVEDIYRGILKNKDDELRLRAAIDEKFKDNEDERKRRHLIVDAIMRNLL
jgi:hypothetical protein